MYRSHWGLKESPFRESLDTRTFYLSPSHDEALARLQFLVDERQRVGLLLGRPGCGKSSVLEVLGRDLKKRGHQVAQLSLAGLAVREFLWQTASAWGLAPEACATEFGLWRMLDDRLIENRYQQRPTILLLDDAHEATEELLAHALRMLHADPGPQARLSVIVSANPEDVERLGPRLLDLVDLRVDVDSWTAEDTAGYLTAALIHCGRTAPIFTPDGVRKLHDLSDGVPRRVKQLAQLSLLAGAGQRVTRIDAHLVEAVHDELGVIHA